MASLSQRLKQCGPLNVTSKDSEASLRRAMYILMNQLNALYPDWIFTHQRSKRIRDLCELANGTGMDRLNPRTNVKPDGGFIFAHNKACPSVKHLLLTAEDKVQGTNDKRRAENKGRQSTGNAIERFAKNLNACAPLCYSRKLYPYVIFIAGCDFHESETITSRVLSGNFYKKPMIYNRRKHGTAHVPSRTMAEMLKEIDLEKKTNQSAACIFIKTHRWDEHDHNSTLWSLHERLILLREVACQSMDEIKNISTTS